MCIRDRAGIVFYTNYASRKGVELAANPLAALQFHWVELERVVRIEGRVEKVSDADSDAYFAVRPLDSRIGAWASPQSQVIPSRATLVANAAKAGARFGVRPPVSYTHLEVYKRQAGTRPRAGPDAGAGRVRRARTSPAPTAVPA